jgi:hypothetical protein
MTVSGISGGFSDYGTQSLTEAEKELLKDSKKLAKDLGSGDLVAAQTDMVSLQTDLQNVTGSQSATQSSGQGQSVSPLDQAASQLEQALQAGNLSMAQTDFPTMLQALKGETAAGYSQPVESQSTATSTTEIGALMSQLGQAMQSGNMVVAQQAYDSLSSQIQQVGQESSQQAWSTITGVSVDV